MDISLSFMPAFYNEHLGLRYGEAYYFDHIYRADIERAESIFLHEILGRYGVGSLDPEPITSIEIQPIDLVMRTQGAEWRFPVDGTVESWGTPWAGLTAQEISGIDPQDAAHHPVVDAILKQYHEMEKTYADRTDIFCTKTGLMNIHTPFTTARQLCGEDLLIAMLTEPRSAEITLDKVWEIYAAIFARITETTKAKLTSIQLGDCAASMLSENVYRSVVLPNNRKLAAQFDSAGYHSCGSSSHLLAAFAEIPKLGSIELGPGTDLHRSVELFGNTHLFPILDPVEILESNPDDIERIAREYVQEVSRAAESTLCLWSLDRHTPVENIAAFYTVFGIRCV